jgi:hypothetical protein
MPLLVFLTTCFCAAGAAAGAIASAPIRMRAADRRETVAPQPAAQPTAEVISPASPRPPCRFARLRRVAESQVAHRVRVHFCGKSICGHGGQALC